ncbi:hypothetical protein evm_008497 [Chilo suppressalis]|nr:hypothetical protein evm_008497 [Chilo suppressalis]
MEVHLRVVLRNLNEIDYECEIEIVTDDENDIFLLVVIHFPNDINTNCAHNKNAFTVFKKRKCLAICNYLGDRDRESPYFIVPFKRNMRFRFISNSSINNDMDAHVYQVTATAGRESPKAGCNWRNETMCTISETGYCITSGVVCDGIKNCGVTDWFDERKSECEAPSERIGYAPVVAVIAVILCVLLAASHCMLRYLPTSANSFFIFNANEDNRLCIDPVLKPPDSAPNDTENVKRKSLIPVGHLFCFTNLSFMVS